MYSLILLILLVIDLFTSAARSGFSNTNLARLLGFREPMQEQVSRTIKILNSLSKLQASLHLARTLLRFLMAGLALLIFVPWETSGTPLLYASLVLLLSGVVIFFLEWLVESQVAVRPEMWALRLTPIARVLMFVLSPLLAVPLMLSRRTNDVHDGAGTVTEDDLKSLVEAGQQEGVFEQGEQKMIFSIFRLGDTLVREIMVPRIDVIALDSEIPLHKAVDIFLESGHSRIPVYKESVDNILGLLYAKDLLRVWHEGRDQVSLIHLMRPAHFVPEAKKVDELLAELQAERVHMAIVVDEYGGVAGLVTLEDIVEEIVGEIMDEYDQAEETPYQVVNENDYIFLGRVDLDDFNEIVGCELPKDEADTLGGLIYSRIGRVPNGGESIQIDDMQLTVEQVSGRRIRKVRAHWTKSQGDNPELQLGEDEHADRRAAA
ncbi:MAG: HlyC/CorC family transporter [Anaerolineales bacterium]|nr:HlyC/CorC family transporter [Anaerolineales bacterium]